MEAMFISYRNLFSSLRLSQCQDQLGSVIYCQNDSLKIETFVVFHKKSLICSKLLFRVYSLVIRKSTLLLKTLVSSHLTENLKYFQVHIFRFGGLLPHTSQIYLTVAHSDFPIYCCVSQILIPFWHTYK